MDDTKNAPEEQPEPVRYGGQIAAALAAAQAEFPVVEKGKAAKSDGRFQGYTYATMADYATVIYPVLSAHGLSYTCLPQWYGERGFHAVGRLLHTSGEHLEGMLPLHGTDPQKIGASISYARRQLFVALTGAVADDETGPEKQQAETAERAQNPRARKSTKAKAAAATTAVAEGQQTDPWADAVRTDSAGGARITAAQVQKQQILFKEIGVEDRPDRLGKTSTIVGRMVSSSNELTMAEGNALIDFLEKKKTDLIADGTIAAPEVGPCSACSGVNGTHSRTCPTQGRD